MVSLLYGTAGIADTAVGEADMAKRVIGIKVVVVILLLDGTAGAADTTMEATGITVVFVLFIIIILFL